MAPIDGIRRLKIDLLLLFLSDPDLRKQADSLITNLALDLGLPVNRIKKMDSRTAKRKLKDSIQGNYDEETNPEGSN